jgi:hypothetical protein
VNSKKRAKCLYSWRYWPSERRGNSPKKLRPEGVELKMARRRRCVSFTGRKEPARSSLLGGGPF